MATQFINPAERKPVLARLNLLPVVLNMDTDYRVWMESKNGMEYPVIMTGAELLTFKGHVQAFPISVERI